VESEKIALFDEIVQLAKWNSTVSGHAWGVLLLLESFRRGCLPKEENT